MIRLMGLVCAALTAALIALAPIPSAQAAPLLAGSGNMLRDTLPQTTELVRRGGFRGGFRGGARGFRAARGFRGGYHRPARFYRPYRAYRGYRPASYGAPFAYGARCLVRPARWIWTAYGYQLRPARRVCRY
jgi:hypothetical protein